MTRLKLERVHYMPKVLAAGVLYVSEEFDIAGHLCACGCGNKVMTPLGPTEWSFKETNGAPSLEPSVGSWQLPCQSHYWITKGEIRWAPKWTREQIADGRRGEEMRRHAYYDALYHRDSWLVRLWRWLVSWLG
jgi:hypothetical protein